MLKAIFFDMDGVLVDACEWHRISLNYALKEISNYEISLEDHYTIYNGIPTKTKLKLLCDKNIINYKDIEKIENIKQEKTIEIINKFAVTRQEKIDLLKYIKDKNIIIACYTNSIRKTAELMLNKTGILNYFDLLITNQDVIKPKPDPEGYNLCITKFNLKPNNCIIIEDSPKGILAAEQTGCKVLKVKNPDEVNIQLLKGII